MEWTIEGGGTTYEVHTVWHGFFPWSAPFRASVRANRTAWGHWTASVSDERGPCGISAHMHCRTLEEAKAWCEQRLAHGREIVALFGAEEYF